MTNEQNLTISQIHEGLENKEFSAVELTQSYLDKIKEKDKKIDAFLMVDDKGALEQARQVDSLIKQGKDLPELAGVPCAIKDNILIKDLLCTAGSKILENYQAVYDATVIDKLKEQKAVFLGKTNLDEFAMGSSTEHSAFKKTKNPIDTSRVPGGSSGGSAAAVASGQAIYALGSDTGGSIRQPASFCGVVGFKPTYGAVSRYGLIAFASSLDQIGPLAKTVGDCEIVFNAIKGKDKNDSTSVEFKKQDINYKKQTNIKIGVPKEYFSEGLDGGVKEIIENAIMKIEKAGAKIIEISLPSSKYALACYYIVATSEASANLARFDGVRYGLQEKGKNLLDVYLKTRGKGFGDEVKRRIMLGTFALSSGYYDAYYLKAQQVRNLIKQDFEKVFKQVDFVLGPVSPFPAFKLGAKLDDPLQMYLADTYTVPVNLAGLPAMSLPVGKIGKLPVGLQIIAPHFADQSIFDFAKNIESII